MTSVVFSPKIRYLQSDHGQSNPNPETFNKTTDQYSKKLSRSQNRRKDLRTVADWKRQRRYSTRNKA